ncbi:class I SAM-dependent methyltransferase [Ktedonosporobacter rubrisoli]|uniref:Class I SAM-dependent methyltransferase n=1 Tax=Ktedonosporobacter rubrisoli TaxID=2509675 RepID=A0A4P6JTQ0_KTERU|nr:class I SAM-dependent methyltransferase [Ktedonosporobacter rubrisoli]QBD78680.1 class I SAM-dependent methyltransferase [Ktedonosporobacter rubrisoli]
MTQSLFAPNEDSSDKISKPGGSIQGSQQISARPKDGHMCIWSSSDRDPQPASSTSVEHEIVRLQQQLIALIACISERRAALYRQAAPCRMAWTSESKEEYNYSLGELLKELMPRLIDYSPFRRVLDVACGAGSWALDIARRYPKLWVLGIDNNAAYIERATAIALNEGLSNVEFLPKDITEVAVAGYAKRPFDMIHLQFVASEITPAYLPTLVHTLAELCRQGGYIVWSEVELPIPNSLPCEQFCQLIIAALRAAGRSFSPGPVLGITPLIGSWLHSERCCIEHDLAHIIDVSADAALRKQFLMQASELGQQVRPFVLNCGIVSYEEYERLFQQTLKDIQMLTFCGICYARTIIARCERPEDPRGTLVKPT